jgi:hypothetical protein
MSFDRIWAIGGFVYSEMVHEIRLQKDLSLLDPRNKNHSYFIRKHDFNRSIKSAQTEKKFVFTCQSKVGDNKRLIEYGFGKRDRPFFIPRYYPSDYLSILCTYSILQEYDFSLGKFIKSILDDHLNDDDLVRKLVFALHLLTYYDIGQPEASEINYKKFFSKANERRDAVLKILSDPPKFQSEYNEFLKKKVFEQKRAWCSLRDFFKSLEFKPYFHSALKAAGFKNMPILDDPSLLASFELPGDVWNNNSKFRLCILKDTGFDQETDSMARVIRKIYGQGITKGYPEQFDITFDFVPRMCDTENCSICPYGILEGRASEFDKVCNPNAQKYCPVALVCCNYRLVCNGSSCVLRQLFIKLQSKQTPAASLI